MKRLLAVVLLALALFAASSVLAQEEEALKALDAAGLIEPTTLDSSLILDIRYATKDNFTGKAVYPSARCFLVRDVAERLIKVHRELRKRGLGLKVYDCYRPLHVQEIFWSILPDERYVLRPERKDGRIVKSSKHNRGAAVDVGLVDGMARELPMPTAFDDFTERAHRNYKGAPAAAIRNKVTLERAMAAQGFELFPTEWWHFDGPGWQQHEPLDLPLPK